MDIENKRIQEIVNFLISNRKIKNTTDFAKKIKHDQGSLTKILDGTRGVTPSFKWKIYDAFRINKPYLFDGIGDLDMEPAQETIAENNELYKLRETVKSQNRSMKLMEKIIKDQDIRIAGLIKELEEKQDPAPESEKTDAKKTRQTSRKMQKIK